LHQKLENLGFKGRAGITLLEYILFEMASKHRVLHEKLADLSFQWWAGITLLEYLLFETILARHENTKFCTYNWRICSGRGGQE
jgi:hypothetical protein